MKLGALITLQYHSLKEVMDVAITYAPKLVQSKYSINPFLFLLSGLNNDYRARVDTAVPSGCLRFCQFVLIFMTEYPGTAVSLQNTIATHPFK